MGDDVLVYKLNTKRTGASLPWLSKQCLLAWDVLAGSPSKDGPHYPRRKTASQISHKGFQGQRNRYLWKAASPRAWDYRKNAFYWGLKDKNPKALHCNRNEDLTFFIFNPNSPSHLQTGEIPGVQKPYRRVDLSSSEFNLQKLKESKWNNAVSLVIITPTCPGAANMWLTLDLTQRVLENLQEKRKWFYFLPFFLTTQLPTSSWD